VEYAEKLKEHVGRRIAELRERAGFTQQDIADAIGTTTPNYQRIEHGIQNVTLETMSRVANALQVRVADFFAPVENVRPRRVGRPKAKKP
jgi:transcriptional regulator with XRE-family HTH domain